MSTELDTKTITIETERLILRPFRQEDLDDLYEYAQNPNVGPNAGWKPHENKEESRQILDHFITGNEVLAITDKSSGKVVGSIGLHKDGKRTYPNARMVGYVLSETYWGLGVMTEAVKALIQYVFTNTDIDILSVMHFPFNNRSKRVIEKCGFRYEGTLRKANVLYDGSVQDELCYSLLKEEWNCTIKEHKN